MMPTQKAIEKIAVDRGFEKILAEELDSEDEFFLDVDSEATCTVIGPCSDDPRYINCIDEKGRPGVLPRDYKVWKSNYKVSGVGRG